MIDISLEQVGERLTIEDWINPYFSSPYQVVPIMIIIHNSGGRLRLWDDNEIACEAIREFMTTCNGS